MRLFLFISIETILFLFLENVNYEDCISIIFDTETTGFQASDEIIQVRNYNLLFYMLLRLFSL